MNILSIGNSFSPNAQRYLHNIARSDGVIINTFNLYIGRFSLGLVWYRSLTGNDVQNIKFCDFDEPVSHREIEIAKKCVMKIE